MIAQIVSYSAGYAPSTTAPYFPLGAKFFSQTSSLVRKGSQARFRLKFEWVSIFERPKANLVAGVEIRALDAKSTSEGALCQLAIQATGKTERSAKRSH